MDYSAANRSSIHAAWPRIQPLGRRCPPSNQHKRIRALDGTSDAGQEPHHEDGQYSRVVPATPLSSASPATDQPAGLCSATCFVASTV